jgi:hypothetical protein
MNKFLFAALLCPMTAMVGFAQGLPAPQADFFPSGHGRMGAYAPASPDNPLVQDARAFIQRQLASMTLNEVTEAYTQVVAGLNVKLVCEVQGQDGTAPWQFIAYRSLDGQWHFHSAARL